MSIHSGKSGDAIEKSQGQVAIDILKHSDDEEAELVDMEEFLKSEAENLFYSELCAPDSTSITAADRSVDSATQGHASGKGCKLPAKTVAGSAGDNTGGRSQPIRVGECTLSELRTRDVMNGFDTCRCFRDYLPLCFAQFISYSSF